MSNAPHPTGPELDPEALAAEYPHACSLGGDDGAGVIMVKLDRSPLPWTDDDLRFLAEAFTRRQSFLLLAKDRDVVAEVAASLMFLAAPAGRA